MDSSLADQKRDHNDLDQLSDFDGATQEVPGNIGTGSSLDERLLGLNSLDADDKPILEDGIWDLDDFDGAMRPAELDNYCEDDQALPSLSTDLEMGEDLSPLGREFMYQEGLSSRRDVDGLADEHLQDTLDENGSSRLDPLTTDPVPGDGIGSMMTAADLVNDHQNDDASKFEDGKLLSIKDMFDDDSTVVPAAARTAAPEASKISSGPRLERDPVGQTKAFHPPRPPARSLEATKLNSAHLPPNLGIPQKKGPRALGPAQVQRRPPGKPQSRVAQKKLLGPPNGILPQHSIAARGPTTSDKIQQAAEEVIKNMFSKPASTTTPPSFSNGYSGGRSGPTSFGQAAEDQAKPGQPAGFGAPAFDANPNGLPSWRKESAFGSRIESESQRLAPWEVNGHAQRTKPKPEPTGADGFFGESPPRLDDDAFDDDVFDDDGYEPGRGIDDDSSWKIRPPAGSEESKELPCTSKFAKFGIPQAPSELDRHPHPSRAQRLPGLQQSHLGPRSSKSHLPRKKAPRPDRMPAAVPKEFSQLFSKDFIGMMSNRLTDPFRHSSSMQSKVGAEQELDDVDIEDLFLEAQAADKMQAQISQMEDSLNDMASVMAEFIQSFKALPTSPTKASKPGEAPAEEEKLAEDKPRTPPSKTRKILSPPSAAPATTDAPPKNPPPASVPSAPADDDFDDDLDGDLCFK